MAVAHVRGLQGGDGTGTYLKAGATCKVGVLVVEGAQPRARRQTKQPQSSTLGQWQSASPPTLPAKQPIHPPTHPSNIHPAVNQPPDSHLPLQHFIGNDLEKWGNATRHNFDAAILPADMRDTFLPPFEACVREARAGSFMCSYNRGEPGAGWRVLLGRLHLVMCFMTFTCVPARPPTPPRPARPPTSQRRAQLHLQRAADRPAAGRARVSGLRGDRWAGASCLGGEAAVLVQGARAIDCVTSGAAEEISGIATCGRLLCAT